MGASSSIMKPQELTEFRKLSTTTENVEIPARPENRTLTDKKGLLMFGITLLVFLPLYGYSMAKTDLRRINHGYDNCGNMCGLNNSQIEGVSCSGKDYTNERYFLSDGDVDNFEELFRGNYLNSRCVSSCTPPNEEQNFMGKCGQHKQKEVSKFGSHRKRRDVYLEKPPKFNEALEHCRTHWWKFVVSILITIALCTMVLLLLRFTPEVIIWGVLIVGLAGAVILTCFLWYSYFQETSYSESRAPLLVASIILTIVTIIVIIVFICLFRKIRLIVQLYKEATKAVFAMPHILLVPVLLTLIQLIIMVALFTSTVYLITSRAFYKIKDETYQYDMNGAMKFTLIFNLIVTSLTMHFITGFQYMVIAGSIAAWYFAKNKQYLDSPILTSFHNTVKFHIGSIAFGSFILTIMDIIRALIKSLFNNEKAKWIIECCCANIEALLKFLSKNAYIETAIHGQSFLRSGRRAAKLLLTNAASVIAINSVGDFVLGVIIFTLIVLSTLISVALFKDSPEYWFPSLICLFINIIIVALTFAIFETTIDTLFICFCEDKVINDGLSKPYFMSRGLMEFVENSKKFYGNKD